MPRPKIEKISEGAYFVFEPSNFNGSIIAYDHLIANQTIMAGDRSPFSLELDQEDSRHDQKSPPLPE
jgi:hypothetical protein